MGKSMKLLTLDLRKCGSISCLKKFHHFCISIFYNLKIIGPINPTSRSLSNTSRALRGRRFLPVPSSSTKIRVNWSKNALKNDNRNYLRIISTFKFICTTLKNTIQKNVTHLTLLVLSEFWDSTQFVESWLEFILL